MNSICMSDVVKNENEKTTSKWITNEYFKFLELINNFKCVMKLCTK